MISEGSHDIKDWSNDAENTAFHRRNKLNTNIYLNPKRFIKELNKITFTVFLQAWFA